MVTVYLIRWSVRENVGLQRCRITEVSLYVVFDAWCSQNFVTGLTSILTMHADPPSPIVQVQWISGTIIMDAFYNVLMCAGSYLESA